MYCHPERQSSSTNQTALRLSSLERFARGLLRNQRFRLGLRRVDSLDKAYEIIISSDNHIKRINHQNLTSPKFKLFLN